jgi:Xaa-Pro aminopeptidase
MRFPTADFQETLKEHGIDAWMMYDMRGSNDLAWHMLEVAPDAHCTRRWAVIIPAHGRPVKVVHRMEQDPLGHIEIDTILYDTRQSWSDALTQATKGLTTIAMEYSPMGEIPVVSKVDAGIVERMRSLGKTIVSSADMLQSFTSVLSEEQIAGAILTAGHLKDTVMDAFGFVVECLQDQGSVTEYAVQQFILHEFARKNLITDSAPIVAIGPNAASPHYAPTLLQTDTITRDTVVLIDAWCKHNSPGAVFADITWVGYTGEMVPHDVESSFRIICNGRDAAVELIKDRCEKNSPMFGWEIDRACRDVIAEAGMGDAFIHRTGHNIGTEVHGPGANMDDFETHDTRRILPGTSFSIEPGVYIPNTLGLRTEIDVIIDHNGAPVIPTEPIQHNVLALFAENWRP